MPEVKLLAHFSFIQDGKLHFTFIDKESKEKLIRACSGEHFPFTDRGFKVIAPKNSLEWPIEHVDTFVGKRVYVYVTVKKYNFAGGPGGQRVVGCSLSFVNMVEALPDYKD